MISWEITEDMFVFSVLVLLKSDWTSTINRQYRFISIITIDSHCNVRTLIELLRTIIVNPFAIKINIISMICVVGNCDCLGLYFFKFYSYNMIIWGILKYIPTINEISCDIHITIL